MSRPNGPRLPTNQGWEPKFQLNMNTAAEELAADVREVLLTITLEAKQGESDRLPRRGQAGRRVHDRAGRPRTI